MSDFLPNLPKTEEFLPSQFWQVFPALSCLAKLHLGFAGLIYLFSMLREVELFVAVENVAYFEDLEQYLKDESETEKLKNLIC